MRRDVRWAVVAAAIILGILGMHTLALHGGHHGEGHGGHGEHPASSYAGMGGDVAIAVDTAMPCALMLGAGAGLLLLLALVRRARRPWVALPALVLARRVDWSVVPRAGPPPEWRFSVIRC
jgi:hypothetical protein